MEEHYSFIDVTALDGVRQRFASGEALLVLSQDLQSIIWANGVGAEMLGEKDPVAVIGGATDLSQAAVRQIMGAPGYHSASRASQVLVRIGGAAKMLSVARITLPDGDTGILLASTTAKSIQDGRTPAERAIAGFAGTDQYLAIIDHEATVVAATDGFATLGIARETLATLIAAVRTERDRIVKQFAASKNGDLPVGIVRLTDDPSTHLLVIVDDPVNLPEIQLDAAPMKSLLPEQTEVVAVAAKATPPEMPLSAMASNAPAVRFLWRTDKEGRLNAVSEEFISAVGANGPDLIGKTFGQIASQLGFDDDGAIVGLLDRRDTWSGRTVMWPARSGQRVPVELAALPAYDRDRNFEGFRGFGVARLADAVDWTPPTHARHDEVRHDEADLQEAPFSGASDEPEFSRIDSETPPEPPVALDQAVEPPALADKVIKLSDHRPTALETTGLSQTERNAFREIGNRLRQDETSKGEPATLPFGKRREKSNSSLSTQVEEQASTSLSEDSIEDADQQDIEALKRLDQLPASIESNDNEATELPEVSRQIVSNEEPVALETKVAAATDTSILDKLPVPILIHAGDRLHYGNAEFFDLTGYSSLDALEAAGGLDALFVSETKAEDDSEQRTFQLRRKDGVLLPIEAILRSVKWGESKALMLVVRQVGDDEPSEPSALAEARTRLDEMRAILDTATDGIVMIDADGTIRSISRPAEALFGFDSDDLTGKPFTSLFAIESQKTAAEYLSGLANHGVASLLNDGREVIGREAQGRFIPLFMTIGRMPNGTGYCAVLRDVTQWKRAEEELSQSRSQAENASSQKTDFLARVSHEIRTPLNAIIGFSELMLDEKFGPIANDRYKDYLRDINRSGNHVLDLVNDLLDISKIEAGEQEMAYEAISLNDALAETVAIMQPQANRERVIIRSSFATKLPQVVADLRSIRQIALNVLSNAVRFTQAGGQVIVSTALEASGDIVMRVRDTGIGMSQAEIEQAMKPFKQINALKRQRGDGTGLGLPLTKAMVEANRARFQITSAPGDGTLVEVVFPSTRVLAQ